MEAGKQIPIANSGIYEYSMTNTMCATCDFLV